MRGSINTLIYQQAHGEPRALPASVPGELRSIIEQLLPNDPKARVASAHLLRARLQACKVDIAPEHLEMGTASTLHSRSVAEATQREFEFRSEPQGAVVSVEGEGRCTAPCSLPLAVRSEHRQVLFRKRGYQSKRDSVDMRAAATLSKSRSIVASRAPQNLRVLTKTS